MGTLFSERIEDGSSDLPVLSVSIHDGVSDRELGDEDLERKVTRSEDRSKYKRVAPGDLVYNMMRAWQGGFGTVAVEGMVSPAYVVARPRGSLETKFVEHVLRTPAAIEEMRRHSRGVTDFRLRLYWDEFKQLQVPLPPAEECRAILTMLDRECGKIDELVAEQERLIALLKEKRQAVISQAVTKGLDPDAPMKDSGIEWLGQVPAHWEVRRIKDVARLESGHTPSKQVNEYWDGGDIEWVSLNDSKHLAANDFISETAFKITAAGLANSSARLLPPGAVVFTRDATIGLVAITTREMAVSQHLIAWCPSSAITSLFLLRVFNAMKSFLDGYTAGATIKTIGMPEVRKLETPVPPIQEQEAIVALIATETARIDTLTAEAERAIALLKERRGALISAAVTGRIDVRGLAAPAAAEAA